MGTFVVVLGLLVPNGAADDGKILFGVFPGARGAQTNQQVLMNLEAQAGHPFGGVRVFDLWNQQFPSSYDTWLRDTGHTLYLSVKARRLSGSVVLWRDIANAAVGSTLYNDIVRWANAVKNFGSTIYFTFNHEPEAGASDSNGSASEFIAAWRKIVTIFRDQGVTNAKYTWIVTDYAFWRTDGGRADLWYPGDDYVDAVGADAYNWYNCRAGISTPWRTLEWIANYQRLWGLNHPNEELLLTEWASHEDTNNAGRKGSWISEAQALFKRPGWEQFTTVLYFHNANRASCNFWLDSSASSMSAWLAMSNDPFYGRVIGSSPDTEMPTVPGQPSGISQDPGQISLEWTASTDDQATTLTYRIYRDGGLVPIGTVSSSSTTTVSFTDTGLSGGSVHTYEVTATDAHNNTSARSPASQQITATGTPVIFADGFDGGFANWSSMSGMTIDQSQGMPAAPSARAQANGSRAWVSRNLGATYPSICVSTGVNLASTSDGSSLIRLRTAGDNGILRVLITGGRTLGLRNDVNGAQTLSSFQLPVGTWTQIRVCGSVGSSGSWTLFRNGSQILGPWTTNTGTSTVGRVTLGTTDPRTITANFDDVLVDMP